MLNKDLDNPARLNRHESRITELAKVDLPDYQSVLKMARDNVSQVSLGTSAFLQTYGFSSELEYKQRCMREGRIMYHAHLGMNDVSNTAEALSRIHLALDNQGYRMDRAGFAIDRRMGLPQQLWSSVAAETGPMLTSAADWSALAQSAPIQPHMGDFMIGQPASLKNTIDALRIGCTTIGNLSQYFTFEAPGWNDHRNTCTESIKAIALLAEFRQQGAMLHSYLEDGYGALFKNCASVAAWAMLEFYIVEDLLGARLTHCIGGLTSDPIKRAGWILALQKIHKGNLVGSMIYGDTISFGPDFEKNRAITAEYLLWDIMIQMRNPSGHAVLPLPVTEAVRIPSADEIIEAQCFARQVEKTATRLLPHVDFSAAEAFADRVCDIGKTIFHNALDGLRQCGVDTNNPLQLLYVLKKMGPQCFEEMFSDQLNHQTSDLTDMYLLSQSVIDEHRVVFESAEIRQRLNGKRLLLASSDVHEHAIGALAQLLSEAGAQVSNLGAEQAPQQLVDVLSRRNFDALLLSTHNGMALDYALQLKKLLVKNEITLPVLMGGVLNQKVEDQVLPISVVDDLIKLGFQPTLTLPGLPELLLLAGKP